MTAPIASGGSESPGGTCTHWKAPPCHGARRFQTSGPRLERGSSVTIREDANTVRLRNLMTDIGVTSGSTAGATICRLPHGKRAKEGRLLRWNQSKLRYASTATNA